MRIYKKQNVYEAALERMRLLFDEFENVVLSFSGGKDSVVVFHLALKVAKEKGRLPLRVLFIDQEGEWNETIDMVKKVMYMPEVEPLWIQMPFKLENATSHSEEFLMIWDPEKEADWLREKDPISIKENKYGVEWWGTDIFKRIIAVEYPNKKVCTIAGMRAEESPRRFVGLTHKPCYKWITWGTRMDKELEHYSFYPLYDWSYTDIWKAIIENKWEYNKVYDYQYMYGTSVQNMRVSALYHVHAVRSLFYLQEFDRELYNKLVKRLGGVDSTGKFGFKDFFAGDLPFMFKDWVEYRNFLAEKLLDLEKDGGQQTKHLVQRYSKKWDTLFDEYGDNEMKQKGARVAVNSIICNDFYGVKLKDFDLTQYDRYRRNRKKEKEQNLANFTYEP